MPVTSNEVANQALMEMGGNQPPVTGNAPNFDDSTAGQALKRLYTPCVRFVGRQFGWDFARNMVALALSGNVAPFPWTLEYIYPANGVQVWQLIPATLTDPNNPIPVNWTVGNVVVSGSQARVIWSDLVNAHAAFNNAPNENTWDDSFREAVVRLLASELAIAIGGKADVASVLLNSAGAMEKVAEGRDS